MIYFAYNADTQLVKIGVTINLPQRMTQLVSDYPRIELLGVMSGSFSEKTSLHDRFAQNRIRRTDWFRDCDNLREYIALHCTQPDYLSPHLAAMVDKPVSLTPYTRLMLDLWMQEQQQDLHYCDVIEQIFEEFMPELSQRAREILGVETNGGD